MPSYVRPGIRKCAKNRALSMSERIKKWAEEKASGSTFLEISGRQLETMPVNLPSLVEQQAIGSFFSHLDDLITLHQRKRLWFAK